MKKREDVGFIVGFIATPIVCILMATIISIGRDKADREFQDALEEFRNAPIQSIKPTIPSDNKAKGISPNSVLPTKEEIISYNASLPVLVSDGTLCVKVEYNEDTKVQTFYYEFTRAVDEGAITQEVINQIKEQMVIALKETNSVDRLKAGVTYLYVYSSKEKKKLYEIKIQASDLE